MDSLSSLGAATTRKSAEHISRAASSNGYYSDGTASSAADVSSSLLETFRTLLTEVDSYVTFYEARIKLEEDHIKNLKVSLERQKELDAKVNSKIVGDVGLMADAQRYPGLRRAWLEMRQNDQRELESSLAQYDEMRGANLPKIRRAYEKKAEEVEQLQLQAQAVEDQPHLAQHKKHRSTNPRTTAGFHLQATLIPWQPSPPATYSSAGVLMRRKSSHRHSRPPVERIGQVARRLGARGGQLGREIHLRLSTHHRGHAGLPCPLPRPARTRKRPSPTSSTSSSRVRAGMQRARRLPRSLAPLITRMREGSQTGPGGYGAGGMGDGGASTPSMSETLLGTFGGASNNPYKATQTLAAKQARVKREMEDADKAYRKANLRPRNAAPSQAADDQSRGSIGGRVPLRIGSHRTSSVAAVGTLHDCAAQQGQRPPPEQRGARSKCIDFIEKNAIALPGIYRISAKQSSVKQLAVAIEKDELGFQFDAAKDEPAAVAGVFKDYLRQLPEPVLAIPWAERIKYTHERQEHIRTGFAVLKGKIRRLPPIHQITLKVIVQHLSKVAQHADQNKMTAANLSVVFFAVPLVRGGSRDDERGGSNGRRQGPWRISSCTATIFDLKTAGAPLLPPISSSRNGELASAGQSAADAAFAASSPTSETGVDLQAPSPSDLPIVTGSANLKRSNAITPATATSTEGAGYYVWPLARQEHKWWLASRPRRKCTARRAREARARSLNLRRYSGRLASRSATSAHQKQFGWTGGRPRRAGGGIEQRCCGRLREARSIEGGSATCRYGSQLS
ncbi:hypothetical protein L1887_56632 [Cichorium endivia]|nr:hypothetical protein L1887_56632 [Cichorium endivia]